VNIFEEVTWRGMIHSATEGVEALLRTSEVTACIGFDPSPSSLHVGSLLPLMALARFQRHGHRPMAVVGGGTGLIGDPSGKTTERSLLGKDQVEENLIGIRQQLGLFLEFGKASNSALLINNAEWLTTIPLTDFLRDVGKYFTVNMMLGKESVRRRLEQQDGISFTEFSYLLLQAYDFLVLYDRYGCTLQMGGSDQWGNITAGCDLIRRVRGASTHALVFPLVTNSSGTKFGKTEAGTIWLDPKRTSPYRFFQFWHNTDDRDVIQYLSFFTWLDEKEIGRLKESVNHQPEQREAQRVLASAVTRIVHGNSGLEKAEAASRVLFGGDMSELSSAEIFDVFADVPSTDVLKRSLRADGIGIVDLLITCSLADSKSDAIRSIGSGGVYVNNIRGANERMVFREPDVIEGEFLIVRKGRRQYHLVHFIGD